MSGDNASEAPYKVVFLRKKAKQTWDEWKRSNRSEAKAVVENLTTSFFTHTHGITYRLREPLDWFSYKGVRYQRWQTKPGPRSDCRVWYGQVDGNVAVERFHTQHPNQTK